MKNRIFKTITCSIVLIMLCGCGNKTENNQNNSSLNSKEIQELKLLIENNNKKIEELKTENNNLEEKLTTITNEKEELNKKISNLETNIKDLENQNKTMNNTISTLKSNNNNSSNKYTISKKDLLGTWKYGDNKITFSENDTEVIDNWIIYNKMAITYMYRDGKLYIADDGVVLNK